MKEYHKINSVFKRDDRGKFTSEFSCPEFEYLRSNQWVWDEKVDGTNIRVHWDGNTVRLGGRTDAAQIYAPLIAVLQEMFPPSKFISTFDPGGEVTLYGEGYGAKIQKGGGNYNPTGVSFILFDVRVGHWYLLRSDVEEIAQKMGVPVTPIVGGGTLDEAISFTQKGFNEHVG